MIAPNLRHKRHLSLHFLLDLVDVVEKVRKGGVDVGESDAWNVVDDLIGFHAHVLMPNDNIEHTHTMTDDTGLAAAYACPSAYPVINGHTSV
jgi:hypothetical protein